MATPTVAPPEITTSLNPDVARVLIPAIVALIFVRAAPDPLKDAAVTTPVTFTPPVALTLTKEPDVNEGVSERVIVAVAPRATAVAVMLLLTKLS